MNSRQRSINSIAGLCVLTLCVACGDSSAPDDTGSASGNSRKILRIAYEREIDVLNAYTSQMLVDISFSMVEGLVTTNERNTYVPVLATEIPTAENGLVTENADGTIDMTWQLHENVRWHDGEALTSEDVCFTWRFVTSPDSQTYNRDQYLGIVDCLMPDEHTVVFRWDGIYGYYAGLFEAILPEHVLGGMTTAEIVNYTPYNRGPELVGTGPFRFAEWKSGEYLRVVRNPNYWRGKRPAGHRRNRLGIHSGFEYATECTKDRPLRLRENRTDTGGRGRGDRRLRRTQGQFEFSHAPRSESEHRTCTNSVRRHRGPTGDVPGD